MARITSKMVPDDLSVERLINDQLIVTALNERVKLKKNEMACWSVVPDSNPVGSAQP